MQLPSRTEVKQMVARLDVLRTRLDDAVDPKAKDALIRERHELALKIELADASYRQIGEAINFYLAKGGGQNRVKKGQ